MLRRRILVSCGAGTPPDGSIAGPLDIVFYNKRVKSLEIIPNESWEYFKGTKYPKSIYTPIGIVVVPGTHGILKDLDGTIRCGVMSLVEMSADSPDTGTVVSSNMVVVFGGQYTALARMQEFGKVVIIEKGTKSAIIGTAETGILPVDGIYYTDKYPEFEEDERLQRMASPYYGDDLQSGVVNQTYFNSGEWNDAVYDRNGPTNTRTYITIPDASQPDWKTDEKISNKVLPSHFPAAQCCWRYHTPGTQQGDWYMPACGELGYICPNYSRINSTIEELKEVYGSGIAVPLNSGKYGTSTLYSGKSSSYKFIRVIELYSGWVDSTQSGFYARAFLRL